MNGYLEFDNDFIVEDIGMHMCLYSESSSIAYSILDERRTLENVSNIPLIMLYPEDRYAIPYAQRLTGGDTQLFTLALFMVKTLMRHAEPINVITVDNEDSILNDILINLSTYYNVNNGIYSMTAKDCYDSGLPDQAFTLILINKDAVDNEDSEAVNSEISRIRSSDSMVLFTSFTQKNLTYDDRYVSMYDDFTVNLGAPQNPALSHMRISVQSVIDNGNKDLLRESYRKLDTLLKKVMADNNISLKLEIIELQEQIMDALVAR